MPITYVHRLRTGLDRLPPSTRRIRAAVTEHFSRLKQGARNDLAFRLRRFAQFMGLRRERWPLAVDRLFSMELRPAEETLNRFRRWIKRQGLPTRTVVSLSNYGFIRLSRVLRSEGAIPWVLRHTSTQKRERQWETCSPGYRSQVEEWIRTQRIRNLVPQTLYSHQGVLQAFGEYLARENLAFDRLGYSDALTWLEGLKNTGPKPRGFNRKLCIVKRFYGWLRARKLIDDSPFETIQSVRLARKLPQVLEEREAVRLIRAAATRRERAVVETLYSTGCRAGELCKLDVNKVSFVEKTARTVGKGGHDRILYLNESALRAIRQYLPFRADILSRNRLEHEPALFLTRHGTRITFNVVIEIVDRCARHARLSKHVHRHMLRHTFATHMLNRGADLFSIMQLMGHKNIQSTVRYLQVATARLSEIHRKYHPRR